MEIRNGNGGLEMSNGNTSMYTSWCSLGKSHSVHSFSLPWEATTWTGFWIHFCLGLSLS